MRFTGGRALSWSRIERILSGRPGPTPVPVAHLDSAAASASAGLSGRDGVGKSDGEAGGLGFAFAELHAVSSYSFLGGASDPEQLVERAVELGLSGLGILDRDGFYGVAAFAEAAARAGLATVFGAELSLPEGVLPVLCRGPEGYCRLSRVLSAAHMKTGEKGKVNYPGIEGLAEAFGATAWCSPTMNGSNV